MNPWSLLRREELRCCPQCGAERPHTAAPCPACGCRCDAPPSWPGWGFWGVVVGVLALSAGLFWGAATWR